MATIAHLLVKVGVDTSAASTSIASFGGKAAAGLRKAFVPSIAVLAGIGLAAKVGFDKMARVQKLTNQTNAVITSTGGAAKISAGGVRDLANALADKSGADDELIHNGANVLLTFTKIRNEVGKGNNIFDQATTLTLDMSMALGQDMKSSAILVGKALNDPIKGVTAMSRAGVQFTEQQKKQIAAMVKSGNTLGAQKIILKELEVQFGGTAVAAGKTLGGQLSIARQRLEGLSMNIVSVLMPAFMGFMSVLLTVTGFLAKHETATKLVVAVVAALAAGVIVANIALKLHAAGVVLWTGVTKTATAATKIWTAMQWLLNAALAGNPIGIVILAVAGLTAAIIVAWRNSETFRNIVTKSFDAVKSAAMAVYNWIKGNWPLLLAILTGPIGVAVLAIVKNWDKVTAAVGAVKAAIGTIVGAVQALKNSPAVQTLDNAFGTVFSAIKSVIHSAAAAIDYLIGKVSSAVSAVSGLASKISSVATGGGLLSKLPFTANGGIFHGAQARIIAEAGPEAVIPLNRPARAAEIMKEAGLTGGEGGGPTINIETMVVQDATDIDRVASRLGRSLMMAGA